VNVIPAIILILIGLLIYLALGESGERLVRRRAESAWTRYGKYVTRPVIVPTVVFLGLAVLMRDWLLTPFLLVVAGLVAYVRIQEAIRDLNTIRVRQISQLVLAFRGAFQIQAAAFKCLGLAAERVSGPLRDSIKVAVETFFATSSPEQGFAVLRQRIDNAFLSQFVYILEMSESAANDAVVRALDDLVVRLRQQEELERQVETGLSSITGQTSFIQVVAVLVGFIIALVPSFRAAYVSTLPWRMVYMSLVGVMIGASYYIEKRNRDLKEQML
jgi:hypothetical protein